MVKRQKEKQYLSAREQRDYQSSRSGSSSLSSSKSRPLPFWHCALTLQPITHTPVCNGQGLLFEQTALAAFVLQHHKDPVTGEPMSTRDIIVLTNIATDDETGDWQCPILQKSLQRNIKVVAIRQRTKQESNNESNETNNTANVYSYQAYQEFNVKAKNYTDLLTGLAFDRHKDVIVLNDPDHPKPDISQFYHIQHARELLHANNNNSQDKNDIRHNRTASRILDKLEKKKKKKRTEDEEKQKKRAREPLDNKKEETNSPNSYHHPLLGQVLAQDVTGVAYNIAQGAASFTSTHVAAPEQATTTSSLARPATLEELLQAEFRILTTGSFKGRKGLVELTVQLETNDKGKNDPQSFTLTLELHTDICPRTCANFLGLCAAGAYNGSPFYRLIPKFMIQGGRAVPPAPDQTVWNTSSMVDELDDRLTHSGPGIVSMANAGPNTNTRQFFVTFASCRHLDRKHSVFGRVVQGLEHLKTLEQVPTTAKNNVPKRAITIVSTKILDNPVQEAHELELDRLQGIVNQRQRRQEKEQPTTKRAKTTLGHFKTSANDDDTTNGVGKYLVHRRMQKQSSTKPKP